MGNDALLCFALIHVRYACIPPLLGQEERTFVKGLFDSYGWMEG